MKEPTRWLASPETSEELRELLREAQQPSPLPHAVRRRGLMRVAKLAPALTILGLSLKAAATTFAASAVVSSVAIVGLQQWQAHQDEAAAPAVSQPGKTQPQATRKLTPRRAQRGEPEGSPGEETPSKSFAALPSAQIVGPGMDAPSHNEPTRGAPATRPAASAETPLVQPGARDRLARETALLESARKALQSAPASALSLVQKHAREFPGGQLRAERMFIEAQALQRLGRFTEARNRAQQALRQYPQGLYAERVREFLEGLR